MKTQLILLGLAFGALALFASSSVIAALDDPAMAGRWSGTADIVVNWTTQRTLRVELVIATDGSVTGTVGDAKISAAQLTRNRGALGRALHVKTDYIVTGDLRGDIIAAEGIRREGTATFPLNWVDGHFEGGLHTSGSSFGGKEKMVLTATRLKLHKNPPAP